MPARELTLKTDISLDSCTTGEVLRVMLRPLLFGGGGCCQSDLNQGSSLLPQLHPRCCKHAPNALVLFLR